MSSPSIGKCTILCSLFLASFVFFAAAPAQDKDWRPVSPADLAAKTPIVEPDADAEALFWEVRIDDSSSDDLSLRHYVRVKIFTERGREKYSKLDVPFTKGMKIKDLAARVIRPDGSIVEIKKEDIFEREIVKANGIKVKAKSFAIPNIDPGVIVEYRYREAINDAGASGMRLQFQRDIPVRKLSYYYKPYNGHSPNYQSYNLTGTKFVKDDGGYYLAERDNIPAFADEPRMPPDDMVRPWMRLTGSRIGLIGASAFSISYIVKDPSNPVRYWGAVSTERSGWVKFMNKSSGDIKKVAAQLTAGAATDDEKLAKIYEYCQKEIKNTTFDPTLTDEQRAKLPATDSIGDVIKRGSGSSMYIDMLFGALAHASGFDPHIALVADRSEMFFDPTMTNDSLVRPGAVGIQVGDKWKFFNPGVPFLPYGMLVWYEEDVWALLVGEKNYVWQKTPMTPYSASLENRSGSLTLLPDGTLQGDIKVELTGQPALDYRLANYDETAAKREERLKDGITKRISLAEVSAISIENLNDGSKPLVQRYRISVPNYAQKTGKRLFLQPNFFEFGTSPIFSSADRKYSIYFSYPWSESDNIDVSLPAGYTLDNADAPGEVADPQSIGSLSVAMGIDREHNLLRYTRKFHFGGGSNILFSVKNYAPLKNLFDAFNKSDTHTVTLKQM